jgi:soluble lytic murein transglycosylase-like protein
MEALIDLGERAKACPDLFQLSRAYLFELIGPKWLGLSNRGHSFLNWVDDSPALPESIKASVDLLAVLGEKELADALVRRHPFANDWDRLRAKKAVFLAFGQEDQAVRQDLLPIESRRGEWNGLPHEFLRRGFPRWHEPLIAHASALTGVPRHLIWAVMREESHFDVDALSGAGAQGLMQIMESTGKGLHLQSGTSRFLKMDLLDPVQNVMLGSRYLATLLTMFQGNELKTLAGYNGGEGNVMRWQKYNGPFTNDLHFALVVPYDESARYVQKVLRSKWMYDVLYPDSVETWKR